VGLQLRVAQLYYLAGDHTNFLKHAYRPMQASLVLQRQAVLPAEV
jgi:hypothetical protein